MTRTKATITDVIARVPGIESGLGTFRGAVRVCPTPDDRANRFELRALVSDPHADATPWPGPPVTPVTEPAELGPFEDAMPCRVLFLRRHAMIGRATGSGKSGLNVLIGNLTACQDVIIWGIGLKRGHGTRPVGLLHRPPGHRPGAGHGAAARRGRRHLNEKMPSELG